MYGIRCSKNILIPVSWNTLLRLMGLSFRIWFVEKLGVHTTAESIRSAVVCGVFVIAVTAGGSIVISCVFTAKSANSQTNLYTLLKNLLLTAIRLGFFVGVIQYWLAQPLAKFLFGNAVSVQAVQAVALGLPFTASACVLRGYCFARRKDLLEQENTLTEPTMQDSMIHYWTGEKEPLTMNGDTLLKLIVAVEMICIGILVLWNNTKQKRSKRERKGKCKKICSK